jgi:alpha-beta hydrolase superfamily lysophospholipase
MAPTTGIDAEYVVVDNAFGRIDGVLRRGSGRTSPTVLVQTHPRASSDGNLTAWPMVDLPLHGIDTFAFNNRYANSTAGTEVITVFEDFALDMAAAVAELRRRGYERVVLYGYSAGGPVVAHYQNVAENGNAVFRDGRTLSGFTGYRDARGDDLRLPPADGIVTHNITTGTGYSFLVRLDGSIVDEARATRDPELDPFEPRNGYDPATGAAHYEPAFLRRYFAAQCRRMNGLVEVARERLERNRAGGGEFVDDGFLVIPGIRAEPASVDLDLAAATRGAWPLYPGGARSIVRSRRRVVPNYARRNRSLRDGGTVHTLTGFLSYRAVLADPEVHDPDGTTPDAGGVDLGSSNATTPGNLAGVTVPLLVTASTADTQVHLPHAELAWNSAVRTPDRSLAFVEGAEHDMTPIDERYGDTRAVHLAIVRDWIAERFPTNA